MDDRALGAVALGGFFSKLFKVFKKSVALVDPIMGGLLSRKKGVKKLIPVLPWKLRGEDLGAEDLTAVALTPANVKAMAAMVAAAHALGAAGLALPADMAALVAAAEAALAGAPGGGAALDAEEALLRAAGAPVPARGMPAWGWWAAGGGVLAAGIGWWLLSGRRRR
jgi:hypothetical protein